MSFAPGLEPGRGCGRRAESARHRHGACPSSNFHERFDAIAVEALTRSQRFGREAAMDGRFNLNSAFSGEQRSREAAKRQAKQWQICGKVEFTWQVKSADGGKGQPSPCLEPSRPRVFAVQLRRLGLRRRTNLPLKAFVPSGWGISLPSALITSILSSAAAHSSGSHAYPDWAGTSRFGRVRHGRVGCPRQRKIPSISLREG